MRILFDTTVVAILVFSAGAIISIVMKRYGAVSIWPI